MPNDGEIRYEFLGIKEINTTHALRVHDKWRESINGESEGRYVRGRNAHTYFGWNPEFTIHAVLSGRRIAGREQYNIQNNQMPSSLTS